MKFDNFFDGFLRKRLKHYHFIDTIEEFGRKIISEAIFYRFFCFSEIFSRIFVVFFLELEADFTRFFVEYILTNIAGHDDDGVFKIYLSSLIVGKNSFVENLQK